MKEKSVFLVIFGILLIIGIIFAFNNLIKQTEIGGNFVKPSWARLECSPSPTYEGTFSFFLDSNNLGKCDAFTEECLVTIKNVKSSGLYNAGRYRKCNLNGGNCGSWVDYGIAPGEEKTLPRIKSGKMYEFETGVFTFGEETTKIIFKWKPWGLYRHVGGGLFLIKKGNCEIGDYQKSKIRKEDSVVRLYKTGEEGQRWINYVDDWFFGPGSNVFIYNGRQVYCSAGQIFEIVKLEMADGRLKKLDPTYEKTLPNGEILNGLGNKIRNVECCPNEPGCSDNFKYEGGEISCFTDIQCLGAGGPLPLDCNTYKKQACINGVCVDQGPFNVECTSSACCPQGLICDLSTTNYGNCIDSSVENYCGDGVCDNLDGETTKTCPEDCGQPESNYCSNCFDWGLNWFREDYKRCNNNIVWKPESTIGKLLNIDVDQDTWCPIYLIMIISVAGLGLSFIIFIVIPFIRRKR